MDGNIVFDVINPQVGYLSLAVGIFIAAIVFIFRSIMTDFKIKETIVCLLFTSILGTIIGSFGYYLFYYNDVLKTEKYLTYYFKIGNLAFLKDNTIQILNNAWMSEHFLILGFVIGCLITSFVFRTKFLKSLDNLIFPVSILLCSLRIKDIFILKNFGLPTERSFGLIFPAIDYIPRHACMIYELIVIFLIIFVLLYISRIINLNYKSDKRDGFLFFFGIFLIYLSKILIGTLKVQDNLTSSSVINYLKVSTDQFINICFLTVALIFAIYTYPDKTQK